MPTKLSRASWNRANFNLFFRLFFYLIRIEILVSLLPYSALNTLLFQKRPLKKQPPVNPIPVLKKHIRMLEFICRLVFWKPNCLRRSVVLRDSLVKDGIDAQIKVGMKKNDGKFEAHAWVTTCDIEVFKNGDYKPLHEKSE